MKKLTALFTIALLACGGGDSSDGTDGSNNDGPDAGSMTEEEDTTAPTILSVSPADGASGVRSDAVVVISFSEPMDQLSVQNSLDTSDLGGIQFQWSDNGATLTIFPDNELKYAEGTSPKELDALQYVVTVGTGAQDEAGNTLAAGGQTAFTTLRSISTTLGRENAMTRAAHPGAIIDEENDELYIGDDGKGGTAKGARAFITMDLSDLPAETADIESATFKAWQSGGNGDVFNELGSVLIEHATFTVATADFNTAVYSEVNGAYNLVPHSLVGVLMASYEDVNVEIDVTDEVRDDLINRVARDDRNQYRLRLESDLNLDDGLDGVRVGRDQLALDVVYLVP